MLEDDLRQVMADETARLRAAPDLVDRVIRSSRRRRTVRTRYVAVVAAAAVVGITVPTGLTLASGHTVVPGPEAVMASSDSTASAVPQPFEPPPLPTPSPTRDFGDLGDGKAFGRVKVGYLPDGLQWSHRSSDWGDEYTTSWNYDGDKNGFYCVQIFVHEGQAAQRTREVVQSYRDKSDGEEATLGDRTGYLVTQWVGEDGGKGTPTMFLTMGSDRMAEIMLSPFFVKDLGTREAVERELKKIAQGLTATDGDPGTTSEAPAPDGGDVGKATEAPAGG
ncbi:hypothetical protein [Streptosporangium roseum]|uniref:Uncharacterized protein n=1 Tax=Streptosporangium roseum (strain ATCC 12428 / DSM 43021 / JCM 3005 / KCTC 9067 / NCIMB 10171 / NRRL 2505 / NI 9100) TaxID=479432 RepID=D2B867_STRRD|nr:hypothetical protein [Streptosporangium roseum]ACZ85857.1 hypothetical protein Sros_2901 [Streptosporangium roseum DSM 43021]